MGKVSITTCSLSECSIPGSITKTHPISCLSAAFYLEMRHSSSCLRKSSWFSDICFQFYKQALRSRFSSNVWDWGSVILKNCIYWRHMSLCICRQSSRHISFTLGLRCEGIKAAALRAVVNLHAQQANPSFVKTVISWVHKYPCVELGKDAEKLALYLFPWSPACWSWLLATWFRRHREKQTDMNADPRDAI